jgi:hypothetical protein
MSEEPTKRRFGGKDVVIGVSALLVLLLLLWLLFQPKPARNLIFGELGGLLPKSTNAATNVAENLPGAVDTFRTLLPMTKTPDVPGSQRIPEGASQPTQEVALAAGGVGIPGTNSGIPTPPVPAGASQDAGQPGNPGTNSGAGVSPANGQDTRPAGGPPNGTTPQLPAASAPAFLSTPQPGTSAGSAPQPGSMTPVPNAPVDVARQSTEDLLQTTGSGRRPSYPASTAPGTQPAAMPPPSSQSAATPNANSPVNPAPSTIGLDASSAQTVTSPSPSPGNANSATPLPSSQASTPSSSQPGVDGAPNVATTPMPDGVAKESTEDLLRAVNKSNSSADPSTRTVNSQTKAANPQTQGANGSTSPADDPGSTDGGGLASGGTAAKLPETETKPLFDPQQSGTNVVFVLDRSLSMMGDKSLAARRELVKTLHHLGANTSFYILLFPYMAMPAPGPLPATRENVDSMGGWLFSVGHRMGSDPVKAVTKALQFNPTTVWLLSDGKFSTSAANAIRSANEPVNARIQTIGFYSREGEAVLRQIASENHGNYRFVPPPGQTATNSVTF